MPVATLPMAVPVNLRSDDDPAGGNRFAGVNLAAPVGVVDPAKRILKMRAQMMRKREERAIDMVGAIAPVISLLPDSRAGVGGRVGRRTPTCRPATCRSIPATRSSRERRYCGTTESGRCPASR